MPSALIIYAHRVSPVPARPKALALPGQIYKPPRAQHKTVPLHSRVLITGQYY